MAHYIQMSLSLNDKYKNKTSMSSKDNLKHYQKKKKNQITRNNSLISEVSKTEGSFTVFTIRQAVFRWQTGQSESGV